MGFAQNPIMLTNGGSPESFKGGYFPTTHWSVVLNAGSVDGGENSAAALEKLCEAYWYPLYVFLRRKGQSKHDAQDHVQSFFGQLIQRESLQTVARSKGKFRSFLLASLNNHLATRSERARAQKRGGGQTPISFDAAEAEERYKLEPVDNRSPDTLYDRRWALTVLNRVFGRLEDEFRKKGNHVLFQRLQPYLIRDGGGETYASLAHDLGKTEEAIKKGVQRLRRRHYELFRDEIAQTVGSPEDLDEEIHYLCRIMAET